jgi:molecular chaperone DnaJ
MSGKDFYKILEVPHNASDDEIKKAYRKLAMKYHPDRNPNDKNAEQKFREISEAYEILKDPQKKATYDRFGSSAFEQGGSSGFGGGFSNFDFSSSDFSGGFSDILGEFFNMNRGRGGNSSREDFHQSGSDVRFNLDISLEEAFNGTNTKVKFTTAVRCNDCAGSGCEGKAKPTNCTSCKGRGKLRFQQGFFTIERTCTSCSGSGKTISNPCKTCSSNGRIKKEKNLEIKIPAGIDDQTSIRISGEGEAGFRGASAGDLYVAVHIKPHRIFKRNGSDIYCKVPIPMTTAALGGEIEVPTIDGSHIFVKIPQGTQNNSHFRLRSKGMSILKSNTRGDMIVEAIVETPVNLNKTQKELLRQFEEAARKENNSPESSGFFAKVKEFWDEINGK